MGYEGEAIASYPAPTPPGQSATDRAFAKLTEAEQRIDKAIERVTAELQPVWFDAGYPEAEKLTSVSERTSERVSMILAHAEALESLATRIEHIGRCIEV